MFSAHVLSILSLSLSNCFCVGLGKTLSTYMGKGLRFFANLRYSDRCNIGDVSEFVALVAHSVAVCIERDVSPTCASACIVFWLILPKNLG